VVTESRGPAAGCGPTAGGESSRRSFLGTSTLVAAGAAALGLAGVAEAAGGLTSGDAVLLNEALGLERLQAAMYAEAVGKGRLRGQLQDFARTVAGHEQVHMRYLTQLLGSRAAAAPRFDFKGATIDPKRFVESAILLEDLAVSAYNGIGPRLSDRALAAAGRIVSVDARHAAWIRAIDGRPPAQEATDPGKSPAEVARIVRGTGFVR
jgi:hypothetical protein